MQEQIGISDQKEETSLSKSKSKNNIYSFAKQFAAGKSNSFSTDHHFTSHAHTNSSSEMDVYKKRFQK